MSKRKNILAFIGSASLNSANLKLVQKIASLTSERFNLTINNDLKALPHFDPELSVHNPPRQIIEFRKSIEQADGIIICTPEYIFSIPSGLKNAIEWCIATTIFSDKPSGLITASASGERGHEELQLIMKTAMARFTADTNILIQGIKGKFDEQGNLTDNETKIKLNNFIDALMKLINESYLSQIFRVLPSPALVLSPNSPNFSIIEVNEAYLQLKKLSRTQVIGKDLLSLFAHNPSYDLTEWRNSLDQVLSQKKTLKLPLVNMKLFAQRRAK